MKILKIEKKSEGILVGGGWWRGGGEAQHSYYSERKYRISLMTMSILIKDIP